MAVDFPQTAVASLHALATTLIDRRKPGSDLALLARDLLAGFYDICARAGLDRITAELGDDERDPALIAELHKINLDGGSPRNQKAKQLADSVIAALGLTVVVEADRAIALPDTVRAELAAAMAQVIDPELAKLKDSIVEEARKRVAEGHLGSFTKMVAQLDDRGQKLIKLPKVSLDAQHAIEHALADARLAVMTRIVNAALDRAKPILEAANADAAARLDAPVSLKVTPREVAVERAADARVPKTAAGVTASIFESLFELAKITFRAAEKPVQPYAASKTFAVGDVIEHPKFGRGSVVSVAGQRIDVEFASGKNTLVHGR